MKLKLIANLIDKDFYDQDTYKFSMGQMVFNQFPRAKATYKYFNRAKDKTFSNELIIQLNSQIDMMEDLYLSDEMYNFFRKTCPWLKETYLQWLKSYRFKRNEIVNCY